MPNQAGLVIYDKVPSSRPLRLALRSLNAVVRGADVRTGRGVTETHEVL